MDFFKNKVTIRLKTGHQLRGLLSQVDYKTNAITLLDIEDLGNAYDKEQLPLDKKIAEKVFEAENIEEILFAEKLFAEPKKYNPDDFFDSMTEHKEKRFHNKGDRDFDRERGDYRPRRGNKGGNYRSNNDRNYEKPRKNYE